MRFKGFSTTASLLSKLKIPEEEEEEEGESSSNPDGQSSFKNRLGFPESELSARSKSSEEKRFSSSPFEKEEDISAAIIEKGKKNRVRAKEVLMMIVVRNCFIVVCGNENKQNE